MPKPHKDAQATTRALFYGVGVVAICLVCCLSYLLGSSTTGSATTKMLREKLVVARTKMQACGDEREKARKRRPKSHDPKVNEVEEKLEALEALNDDLLAENSRVTEELDSAKDIVGELKQALGDEEELFDQEDEQLLRQVVANLPIRSVEMEEFLSGLEQGKKVTMDEAIDAALDTLMSLKTTQDKCRNGTKKLDPSMRFKDIEVERPKEAKEDPSLKLDAEDAEEVGGGARGHALAEDEDGTEKPEERKKRKEDPDLKEEMEGVADRGGDEGEGV